MQKKPEKNTEKTPEKLFLKRQNTRKIRIVVLKCVEILILYTRPLTVTELVAELSNEGHQVSNDLVSRQILKEITKYPVPGYQMITKLTTRGTNKQVASYQLKKIEWKKRSTTPKH